MGSLNFAESEHFDNIYTYLGGLSSMALQKMTWT